jgi:hypothetical protein
VRLSQTGTQLFGTRLTLVELNGGTEVHSTEEWRLREAREAPLSSIEAIVGEDPTVLRSVLQLSGYAPMMAAFVERHGVKDFVRTAAVYMLGRLPDEVGLESYERLLENGAVTPFGLFAMLGASEELKTAPRLLQSPVHPGFLFAGRGRARRSARGFHPGLAAGAAVAAWLDLRVARHRRRAAAAGTARGAAAGHPGGAGDKDDAALRGAARDLHPWRLARLAGRAACRHAAPPVTDRRARAEAHPRADQPHVLLRPRHARGGGGAAPPDRRRAGAVRRPGVAGEWRAVLPHRASAR